MDGGTILGSAKIGLGDQLRASWNRRTRYALLFIMAVVPVVTLIQSPPHMTTSFEIGLYVFVTIMMVLLVGLFWFVLRTAVIAIAFTVQLGREQRAMSYAIGDESIVLRDQTGTTLTTPWGVVRRARETKRAFRFELRLGTRYIPKRAFAGDDIVLLRQLLTLKLGKKAKLRPA